MLNFTIRREDYRDYLEWIKSILTICSAAIGALVFKFDVDAPYNIKVASVCFLFSIVFLVVTYSGIIEHKNSSSDTVQGKTFSMLLLAYLAFLSAFSFLILHTIS